MIAPLQQTNVGRQVKDDSCRILIITLNWNTPEETVECLDSLVRVSNSRFSVAVIDNASDDASLEVLRRWIRAQGGHKLQSADTKWRDQPLGIVSYGIPLKASSGAELTIYLISCARNYGFPGGNNLGFQLASQIGAKYAVLLNNDVVVDAGFLKELEQVADGDERIGVVGPKVYDYGSPAAIQSAGVKIHWIGGRLENLGSGPDFGQCDALADRDAVYGTCMLVRASMVDQIGGLDERFGFGGEEIDFCIRAHKSGYRVVYAPSSRIWHKGGRSAAKLAGRPEALAAIRGSRGFLGIRYQAELFKKHLPFPVYVVPIAVRTTVALVAFIGVLVLVVTRKESLSGRSHVNGVDLLYRLDVEAFVHTIFRYIRFGPKS